MRILVDMDGVIANCEGHFWDVWPAYVKDAPITPSAERLTYGVEDQLPVRCRNIALTVFQTKGFFRDIQPMPGAIEGLLGLERAGHSVHICTRPFFGNPHCASEKHVWVRDWLGADWERKLAIVHDKTLIRGDVLIDDMPEIKGSEEPEWKHVLYDWPYNRDSNKDRVRSWDEILERWG